MEDKLKTALSDMIYGLTCSMSPIVEERIYEDVIVDSDWRDSVTARIVG
jgi:hypothetical protein